MMLGWETLSHGGQSPGRTDQYLYPYYENDIEAGRITKERAQELLDCWFMRYSQMFSIMPEGQAVFMSNHTSAHHIDVGGKIFGQYRIIQIRQNNQQCATSDLCSDKGKQFIEIR